MQLNQALLDFNGNAETLALITALHYVTAGKVDIKHIDNEGMAIAVFDLINQLEAEHPGITGRYGYAKIADLQAFGAAIGAASQATKPAGLIG